MLISAIIEKLYRQNNFNVQTVFRQFPSKCLLDEIEKRNMSPFNFLPCNDEEFKIYMNLNEDEKKKFVSNTAYIEIVDMELEHYVELLKCDGCKIYDYNRNLLKNYLVNSIDADEAMVIFVFLHELGHYEQFCTLDRKMYEFIKSGEKEYKNHMEKMTKIVKIIEQEGKTTKKGKIVLPNSVEKALEKARCEYRNLPKEKFADDYALRQFEQMQLRYLEE